MKALILAVLLLPTTAMAQSVTYENVADVTRMAVALRDSCEAGDRTACLALSNHCLQFIHTEQDYQYIRAWIYNFSHLKESFRQVSTVRRCKSGHFIIKP